MKKLKTSIFYEICKGSTLWNIHENSSKWSILDFRIYFAQLAWRQKMMKWWNFVLFQNDEMMEWWNFVPFRMMKWWNDEISLPFRMMKWWNDEISSLSEWWNDEMMKFQTFQNDEMMKFKRRVITYKSIKLTYEFGLSWLWTVKFVIVNWLQGEILNPQHSWHGLDL